MLIVMVALRRCLWLVIGFGVAIGAVCAPTTSALANIGPQFWEDDKPSVTGNSQRSARRAAKVSRQAASDDDADETTTKRSRRATRYAARGPVEYDPRPQRSLSGGGVSWSAPSGCLNGTLRSVVSEIASSFGGVRVTSTCRSRTQNARAGGARKSHHLSGDAVDFRVFGNVRSALAYLRNHGSIGGVKHYGGGLIHADTGPRRSW